MSEDAKSRLLWEWGRSKSDIKAFLADPLDWVANELQKVHDREATNDPYRREDWEDVKTLIEIINFLNKNKKLLTG